MPDKGTISINAQNIMPVIKKWLYSDKDIFVRELVSNGSDAIHKMKRLVSVGDAENSEEYRVDVVIDKEGFEMARWLAERGIAAFVLFYRLPHQGWTAGPDVALADAQRAIRLIRHSHAAYGIDPVEIARASVLGQPVHLMSPLVASTLLLVGMVDRDIGDFQKATVKWAVLTSLVITALALVTGALSFFV